MMGQELVIFRRRWWRWCGCVGSGCCSFRSRSCVFSAKSLFVVVEDVVGCVAGCAFSVGMPRPNFSKVRSLPRQQTLLCPSLVELGEYNLRVEGTEGARKEEEY
ncbi:hypothetical protein KCU85_g147, partial [Aureobasidium melanogenum]